MSYRNVGEFRPGAGRKLKNSPISRFWKENTLFRNGKSKEELLRNARQFQQRKSLTAKKLFFDLWFYQPDERADLKSTFLKSADFPGMFECFKECNTNNYRFDCQFVLKYYSNRSPCGENYTLLLLRTWSHPLSAQYLCALYPINCLKLCKEAGALKHREIVG